MRGLIAASLMLLVLAAGCIGNNFVYSKGKTLSPGAEKSWIFKGPADLKIRVSSNVPVEVKVISSDGKVLRDFGRIKKVDSTVNLPEGKWKVVIKNPNGERAVLDISIRT